MPRLKVNNSVFYREPAISQEEISYPDGLRKGDWKQEDFIKDIEQDLIDNPAAEYIPKYQTHAQIYERMKGRKHWDDLLHKIRHQLCNMPFELAVHPQNHRYSIVFDFNIDKSTNPDNIAE